MTDDADAGYFGLEPDDARWFAAHGEIAAALSASGIAFGEGGGETRGHLANLLASGVLAALERAGLSVVAGDDSEED